MHARLCRPLAGIVLFLMALLPLEAAADTGRVALVMGNGNYGPEIGALRNPANDAKLMARTLKQLGFEVMLAIDADQKTMKRHIRDFGAALTAAGPDAVGLFYYAGHGIQVGGTNYLLPIGAEIRGEGDVELEAISANSILAQMEYAPNSIDLVFLDACRNNPLTRGFRSASRGLARVDAPRGSFVGYSTAPGEVSVDGTGNNSPYTLALSQELLTPGQAIEEVHRAVRLKVLAATQDQQTPWDSSSLTATVRLAAPAAPATQPAAQPAAAAAPANTIEAERAYWESAKDSTNPDIFQDYLNQFPNGIYAALARDKLARLAGASAVPASASAAAPASAAANVAAATPSDTAAGNMVATREAFVAVKNANIRAEPNAKARVLGKLKAEDPVTVIGRSADAEWLQVASAAGTGFVSAQLLKPDAAPVTQLPAPVAPPAPAPAPQSLVKANALRIDEALRPEIERYLVNSQKQTGNFRFLAVSEDGRRVGVSISCKTKSAGFGGWAAQGCTEEADAKKIALSECGGNCRIIFNQAAKVGDFEIEWVKADGSSESADLPIAAQAPAPIAEPAPEQPVAVASAPSDAPAGILRISASLKDEVEKYLANSQDQAANFRFLAVSETGDRIGVSISCKKKSVGFGGWAAQGCDDETEAKRLALEECGGNCRIIFNQATKVGDFEIEWY
jgi:uncharacterized caspase-like protein